MMRVLERHSRHSEDTRPRQGPEMSAGIQPKCNQNGFSSRGIAETDRAYIHLPNTGMDLFARLYSGETMRGPAPKSAYRAAVVLREDRNGNYDNNDEAPYS
jgi:hypothetical protein